MRTIDGMEELAAEGERLGVSDWYDVTQQRVNAFAEGTGDRYWIHRSAWPSRQAKRPTPRALTSAEIT